MAGFFDFLTQPNTLAGMRSLNSAGVGLEVGGALTSSVSRFQYGGLQRQAAQFQADQMREQAGEAQASSQRSAWDVDQTAKYIASDALAKAAASGGGASDPSVVNTIARIAQEGAYRQQLALYGGNLRSRQLNLQADAKDYEGALAEKQSMQAGASGMLEVGTSLLKGNARDSSLLQRFGGNGPQISGSNFGSSGVY